MEDTAPKLCGRCGQPVDRTKDSWEQIGGAVVHAACPMSPEMRALPTLPESKSPAAVAGSRPEYLTIDEVAKLLRISDRTIRRRIRSGELPAKRLKGGQTVLIDLVDALALLEDAREAV